MAISMVSRRRFGILAAGFVFAFTTAALAAASLPHPRWKVQVLIYTDTDIAWTDGSGNAHHVTATMTPEERQLLVDQAKRFFEVDVPALTSGNMTPLLTVTLVPHPLTKANVSSPWGCGFWPDPGTVAGDLSPSLYDSAVVIWKEWGFDSVTGQYTHLGCFGGLTWPRGTSQTYASFIHSMVPADHRNVFKHEWGHSILFYYNDSATAPKPAVDNHINDTTTRYGHCGSGQPYILLDETDGSPIPNSIYNNVTGFTHDYYSGTTATPDQPTRCLGITPQAWASGGPVTRPIAHPGDLNGDGKVDRVDLALIMAAAGQLASGPNDQRDLDYDGRITVLDARRLVTLCTNLGCAP